MSISIPILGWELSHHWSAVRAIPFEILGGGRNGKFRAPLLTYFYSFCRSPTHFNFFADAPPLYFYFFAAPHYFSIPPKVSGSNNTPLKNLLLCWEISVFMEVWHTHCNMLCQIATSNHQLNTGYAFSDKALGSSHHLWQSTGGKWWLTHWASLLRWIRSISEYNLWLGTARNGPLRVDHVTGIVEGADLQNKSQTPTHVDP